MRRAIAHQEPDDCRRQDQRFHGGGNPNQVLQMGKSLGEKIPGGVRGGCEKNEKKCTDWQGWLPETQSLLRLFPLGFLPLGADRPVLCGAWTGSSEPEP